MKRIAILGCENSHANNFLTLVKERERYSDVEVVGVFSEEREAAEKLREKFGVPILEDFAEAKGKIDGLIITARHGDNHYKFARPYLEDKIPMFIDKPITISEDEAVSFMRDLRCRGIRFSGGFSFADSSADEVTDGCNFQASHGVTSILPTVSTGAFSDMKRSLENIAAAMDSRLAKIIYWVLTLKARTSHLSSAARSIPRI